MARISGVNLPNKPVAIALTYIFGIGRTSAKKICDVAKVAGDIRANDVGDDELARIRDVIDRDYLIEGELRRETAMWKHCQCCPNTSPRSATCEPQFEVHCRLYRYFKDFRNYEVIRNRNFLSADFSVAACV